MSCAQPAQRQCLQVLFVSNAPFFCFNQGSVTLSQGNPFAGTTTKLS
jgi:hypothetical protein